MAPMKIALIVVLVLVLKAEYDDEGGEFSSVVTAHAILPCTLIAK